MTFDHDLKLINVTSDKNKMGDPVEVSNGERDVLCAVDSIGYREFYEAARTDLNPEIKFLVNKYEYLGEKYAEFRGKLYRIIRSYEVRNPKSLDEFETIELICEGVSNNAIT